ncbi:MAG: hypothetical protein ACLUNH_06565 [Hominenteromicrobium sp.]|uniref:hypothetical protein n=1 Tax=Hominenteromicrobium sp. TaxID=3073581 RepID=UPI0039964F9B
MENTPSRTMYAVSRGHKNALNSWRIRLSHPMTEDKLDEFERIFDKLYLEFT